MTAVEKRMRRRARQMTPAAGGKLTPKAVFFHRAAALRRQMEKLGLGACVLFAAVFIRQAIASRPMQIFFTGSGCALLPAFPYGDCLLSREV